MAARDSFRRRTGLRRALRDGPRAVRHYTAAVKDYLLAVGARAFDDNVFFLASALTFSVLLAAVPLLLILVSLIGLAAQATAGATGLDPGVQLRQYLETLVPVLEPSNATPSEASLPDEVITLALQRGTTVGLIGFAGYLWFTTRLFSSVRAVLRNVFAFPESRPFVRGKLFDLAMVLVASVLVILNLGLTFVFDLAKERSFELLGLSPEQLGLVKSLSAEITAFGLIFLLFVLVYRYMPARRVPWRMAVLAAGFSAVCWEMLKLAFAYAVTEFADFGSLYGGLATLVVVVVWCYYMAVAFVLGAEVAQVYELRRQAALAGQVAS